MNSGKHWETPTMKNTCNGRYVCILLICPENMKLSNCPVI